MATKCDLPKDQIDVSLSSGSLKLTISIWASAAPTRVRVSTLLRDVDTWRDLVQMLAEQPGFEDAKVDPKTDLSFIPPAIGEWQPAQSGGASSAGVAGAADRVAAQEAVFTAILGDPSKPLTKSSDEELAALARATGLDPAAMATMSREEKIAAISGRRESALRAAAASAGIVGAETMPAAQLAAALKAEPGGASPAGVAGAADRVAAQEAVFTAILGDPSKSLTNSSDQELAALARATGLDPTAMSMMSRGEKGAPNPIVRLDEAARAAGGAGSTKHGA